jgi:SAM-dependent methyltransferase
MAFLTKSQAAKHFNVSPTTINNWIIAAEKNKIDLEIATVGSKTVVMDSEHNTKLILSLINKGKKHIGRSSRVFIDIKKDSKLYKIFSRQQLTELVSSISSRSEIPYKFSYLDQGADLWNEHHKFSNDNEKNFVSKEHKLIVDNLDNIVNRFRNYKYINITDFGCGNGLPVIPILEKLLKEGFKVTYTALDISQRMLDIDEKELLNNFPNLQYTSQVLDFDRFNISDILMFSKKEKEAANLLLYLGGTLGNQTDTGRIYANLRDSMGLDDFLLVSEGITTSLPKNTATQSNKYHLKRTTWILDLLGLKDYYSDGVFDIFDPLKKETSRKIPILKDITINLSIDSKNFEINLNQGGEILVFRFYWYKETEIIQQVVEHGFVIDQFTSNLDGSCALMMVRPKQV